MKIQVVTHNGRMPCDGGIRLGYVVGNKLFPVGGGQLFLPPPPKPVPEVKVAAKPPLPVLYGPYSDLWLSKRSYEAYCPHCDWYPKDARLVTMLTDEGEKPVYICRISSCQEMFRPWRR